MYKIRTYNALSAKGLDSFPAAGYEVSSDCEAPHGFMLRSHKLHTEAVPDSLAAVARAGAGVNNIPVDAYTERGIVVFNHTRCQCQCCQGTDRCSPDDGLARYLRRHELCSGSDTD